MLKYGLHVPGVTDEKRWLSSGKCLHRELLIQLNTRHWEIYDALNNLEVVDGEGVIGKKPVIKPGESYTYSSGCLLSSPLGAMKGYFNMVNFTSTRSFRVTIPTFKLSAPFAIN